MGNNKLKKVNFVLACLVMLASFAVSYQYNVYKSEIPIKAALAVVEDESNVAPAMATAEILDESQGDVRIAAVPPTAIEYEVKAPEVIDTVYEEKLSFSYEGSEVKFSLETIKDIATIDWGDGNKEEVLSGDISHKYNVAGKYIIKLDGIDSLDISGEKGIYSLVSNGYSELVELKCGNTRISNLRLNGCESLIYLDCNNTIIDVLDLTDSPDLEYLYYGKGIKSIKLNSECKTKLKLSGSSETIIVYAGEIVEPSLPEFKLNESNMSIDLGSDYKKYEFAVTANRNWYRDTSEWYHADSNWISAFESKAVKNNKLYVSDIDNNFWDNDTGITIREKDNKDKSDARIKVPKYRVVVNGTNGKREIHEYVPLQEVKFYIHVEEGTEQTAEIIKAININKEAINIEKFDQLICLTFKMPHDDVVINLNVDIEYLIRSSNQVESFAENFEPGDKFTITAPGGRFEGYYWEDGTIIDMKGYNNNGEKVAYQLKIPNEIDSGITMYGVQKTVEIIGASYELNSQNSSVKLMFEDSGRVYYSIANVEKNHADAKTFYNFLCYVISNNYDIEITINEEIPQFEIINAQIDLGDEWSKYGHGWLARYEFYNSFNEADKQVVDIQSADYICDWDYLAFSDYAIFDKETNEVIQTITARTRDDLPTVVVDEENRQITIENYSDFEYKIANIYEKEDGIKIIYGKWRECTDSTIKANCGEDADVIISVRRKIGSLGNGILPAVSSYTFDGLDETPGVPTIWKGSNIALEEDYEETVENWVFAILTGVNEAYEDNENDNLIYKDIRVLLSDGLISRDYKFVYDSKKDSFVEFDALDSFIGELMAFKPNKNGEISLDSYDIVVNDNTPDEVGDNYIMECFEAGTEVDDDRRRISDKRFVSNTVIFNKGYNTETGTISPEVLTEWDSLVKYGELNQLTFIVYEKDSKNISYVFVDSVEYIVSDTEYAIVMTDDYKEKLGDVTKKYVKFLTVDGEVDFETREVDKDYVKNQQNHFVEYNLFNSKLNSATSLIDIDKFNKLKDEDSLLIAADEYHTMNVINNGEKTKIVAEFGTVRPRSKLKGNYKVVDTQKLLLEYDKVNGGFEDVIVSENANIYYLADEWIRTITFKELRRIVEDFGYLYVIPYANENAPGYGTEKVEANILVVVDAMNSITLPVPDKIREFKDVKEDAWYYDIVTTTDYLEGTTSITFSPDDPLTREMFITAVYNIAGEPVPNGKNSFSDIPEGAWSEDAIIWASENSLVSGFPDGRFKPSENVTRQEAIVILKKFTEHNNYPTDKRADLGKFADANEIYDWAVESMSWAVAEGIISGDNHNSLSATKDLTRAEMMAIFHNATKPVLVL